MMTRRLIVPGTLPEIADPVRPLSLMQRIVDWMTCSIPALWATIFWISVWSGLFDSKSDVTSSFPAILEALIVMSGLFAVLSGSFLLLVGLIGRGGMTWTHWMLVSLSISPLVRLWIPA